MWGHIVVGLFGRSAKSIWAVQSIGHQSNRIRRMHEPHAAVDFDHIRRCCFLRKPTKYKKRQRPVFIVSLSLSLSLSFAFVFTVPSPSLLSLSISQSASQSGKKSSFHSYQWLLLLTSQAFSFLRPNPTLPRILFAAEWPYSNVAFFLFSSDLARSFLPLLP